MNSDTNTYSTDEFDSYLVDSILNEVFDSLKEKGYNPVDQLVGYLMSGDSGYISSYKGSRNKITSINRGKIIKFLLEKHLLSGDNE